jgi:hypothetical protein
MTKPSAKPSANPNHEGANDHLASRAGAAPTTYYALQRQEEELAAGQYRVDPPQQAGAGPLQNLPPSAWPDHSGVEPPLGIDISTVEDMTTVPHGGSAAQAAQTPDDTFPNFTADASLPPEDEQS